MKRARDILLVTAVVGLLTSMVSCGMGGQLAWQGALVAGFYAFGVSLLPALAAGVLAAIEWLRNNVKIK